MKANELMIGDWVLSEGKYFKVVNLTDKVTMIDDNLTRWIAEEVQPILLTTEILEQNGFLLFIGGQYFLPRGINECIVNIINGTQQ